METISSIKGDYSSLMDENGKLKEINSDLNVKYSKFESEYMDLEKNYSDLILEKNKLVEDNSKLKIEKDGLMESFSSVKEINSELEDEISKLNEVNSELEDEISKLNEVNSDLDDKYSKFESDNADLKRINSDLTLLNEELDEDNSRLRKEKMELEEKFSVLENIDWNFYSESDSDEEILKENYTFLNSILANKFKNLVNNDVEPSQGKVRLDKSYSSVKGDDSNLKDVTKNLKKNYSFLNSIMENKFRNLGNNDVKSSQGKVRLDKGSSSIKKVNSKLKDEK
jgi:predicted  nucleic acid-binding Zn-ribbon protein